MAARTPGVRRRLPPRDPRGNAPSVAGVRSGARVATARAVGSPRSGHVDGTTRSREPASAIRRHRAGRPGRSTRVARQLRPGATAIRGTAVCVDGGDPSRAIPGVALCRAVRRSGIGSRLVSGWNYLALGPARHLPARFDHGGLAAVAPRPAMAGGGGDWTGCLYSCVPGAALALLCGSIPAGVGFGDWHRRTARCGGRRGHRAIHVCRDVWPRGAPGAKAARLRFPQSGRRARNAQAPSFSTIDSTRNPIGSRSLRQASMS